MSNILNNNNQISWLEKYRPKKLTDYYISKKQLDIVKLFIRDFRNKTEDIKPFLILYGSTGIGKTTLAHLIFEYYDYEIIECNASDTRTKKTIRESIGQISKVSVCIDEKNKFKETAIIMDEIDGLSGGESNSVQELIDIVTKDKDSKKNNTYLCPVICTTNSIKDKKLAPLIKQGIVLNLSKPPDNDCLKLINKILLVENFSISEEIKNDIIEKAFGDYRQIIMLLFEYYHTLKSITNNNTNINTNTNTNTNTNKNIDNKFNIILNYDDESYHYNVIKQISNVCETPLEKINYFLTNNTDFENIRHICSDDSNLYYMNFYINIINIINLIQLKEGIKSKESMLLYYKLLYNIYNLLKNADLLNNTIFLEKNWDMLDYFDTIGLALPINILHKKNIKYNKNIIETDNNSNNSNTKCKYLIQEFQLMHHTQYNFMRQEQSLIKKKFNIDYCKTHDIDLTNLYYNLKRFKVINKEKIEISDSQSKKKKSLLNNENNKFQINKTYLKIIDKIDELLR